LEVSETDNKMKKINFKKIKNGGFTLQNPAKRDLGGFTLVEMLVAIFVFITVLGASSAIFVDVIRNQKRALANQELLNQTSYVLEYMSRAIRMAKKDDIGGVVNCLLGNKVNYEKTNNRILGGLNYSGPGIKFRNYENICQEFFLDNNGNQLKESKSNAAPLPLTPSDLKVNFFNIGPDTSWSQEENPPQQPRVTLFLDIERSDFPSGKKPEIKIQTTISQRNLDVQY